MRHNAAKVMSRRPAPGGAPARDDETTRDDETGGFRARLLDGLAASIKDKGYRNTTVADIVRCARTSRRTFYEHFSGKEACFVALITDANAEMIRQIAAAVDLSAPWESQVRQAVEAWIACSEAEPALMLSWIRDVPTLGDAARRLQREVLDAFVDTIQAFCDTDEWRAAGAGPVPRQVVIMLVGGLCELTATSFEHGGRMSDVSEVAVQAAIALLAPRA